MDAPVSRLRFVPFEVPTAVSEPPEGDDWIHEVKFDGYRTQLVIERRKIRAYSRRGLDWTDRYPGVIAAAKELPVKSAMLDGETVIMDKDGVSDFSALIKAVHKKSDAISFVAFDLLHLEGEDLRKLPLIERRERLRDLLPDDYGIQYSDHFVASGAEVLAAARLMGLEGIVSKRAKAPYRSGPSRNWLKTKNYVEVELPILGVMQEAGKPTLALLGSAEDRTYLGSAAVVINKLNRDLFWRAVEFLTDRDKKRADDNMRWLKPGLVGRVRYLWGNSGLRHATVMSFWLEDVPCVLRLHALCHMSFGSIYFMLSASASLMSCPRCRRRAKSSARLAPLLVPLAHSLLSPLSSALVVFTRASNPFRARAGM
jgi:bifunctional non-homologous end joining protein LigD